MTKPIDSDVLSQLTRFLARYLQCSEHQCTVLALWVLHTYTFSAAQVTPYLSIRSSYKQSGKTFCLQLLSLLCDNPLYTQAFTASALARMKPRPSTVLLDEFQATFGTRSRSKALALRALLAGSFHRNPLAAEGGLALGSALPFCPKAFAGVGQLPEELADRSISIILEPLVGDRTFLGYDYKREKVVGSKPPASRSHVEQPPSARWGMRDLTPAEIKINSNGQKNTTGQINITGPHSDVSQKNTTGPQPPGSPARGDFSRAGVEVPPAAFANGGETSPTASTPSAASDPVPCSLSPLPPPASISLKSPRKLVPSKSC